MKLTIVLTVYNKERFLDKAFQALLNQSGATSEDYEILAVNDGSTDGSAALLDRYAQQDSRIRILTQQNQGLSMARNNGTNIASGRYVWYVDADDTISTNAVQSICKAIDSNPDVIPIYAQTDGIDFMRNAVIPDAKTGKDVLIGGHWEQCGVFWVLKREFLKDNNLRFMPGVYHEDSEFTPRMLYAAKSVKVIPEILYTVYRVPDSITQVPRAKRAFDLLVVSESLSEFVISNKENRTPIGRSIDRFTAQYINEAFDVISQNSREDQFRLNCEFYKRRRVLLRVLRDAPKQKYKMEAFLFKLFPKHYVWVYKILKGR